MKEDRVSHVTLAGDLAGAYVIEERLPDGRLVLRPDTSVEAIVARTGGGRQLTAEEFAENFGELPEDDEG
jgi:hypothetical protein